MVLGGWVRQILLNPLETFAPQTSSYLNSVKQRQLFLLFGWNTVTQLLVLVHLKTVNSPKLSRFLIFEGKCGDICSQNFDTLQVCFIFARQRWSFSKGIIKHTTTGAATTHKGLLWLAHLDHKLVKSYSYFLAPISFLLLRLLAVKKTLQ